MNIFNRFKTRYILHSYPIKHDLWTTVTDNLSVLQGLSSVEKAHLRELSTLFLQQKNIVGINIDVTEKMQVLIAAQACLPILELDVDSLANWSEIVLYPEAFHVDRNEMDNMGIVHHYERELSGEAWPDGPIVLSWKDIEHDYRAPHQGHNVIIHEIAHKLDMLNGSSNGMPPLHRKMSITAWSTTLSTAYEQLHKHLEHHQRVCVNPYAATNPAEFFAVFSEYFFSVPEVLQQNFGAVYEQMQLYYRQDPLARRQS